MSLKYICNFCGDDASKIITLSKNIYNEDGNIVKTVKMHVSLENTRFVDKADIAYRSDNVHICKSCLIEALQEDNR